MKTLAALLITLLVQAVIYAQPVTIYGVMPSGNPNNEYLRLTAIDAMTGTIIRIDSMTPVSGISLGTSAFDSYHRTYSFIGVDPDQVFRFNSWSVVADSMYAMPLAGSNINDLEYDMNHLAFYGLGSYSIGGGEYALRFLTIDQQTGQVTELNRMPEASAFPAGSTTLDANNGIYYANIITSSNISEIYAIEGNTGEVLSTVPLSFPYGVDILNLEYNNQNNMIYGISRDYFSDWTAIVELDPQTGMLTDTILEITDLEYFVQGASVFHQMSQNYFLYYIDTINQSRLLSVDVVNHSMTANPEVSGYVIDLQVDNNDYAMATYHPNVGVDALEVPAPSLSLSPNPAARGPVHISLSATTAGGLCDIRVYDITMTEVWRSDRQPEVAPSTWLMETDPLKPGTYVVKVQAGGISASRLLIITR